MRTTNRAVFATTLNYPTRTEWVRRGHCLTTDGPGSLKSIARVLAAGRAGTTLVLNGFGTADRIAAALLARRRGGPTIILTDCTWKRGKTRVDRFWTAVGVAALSGPNVVFCVSSTDELAAFPKTWGIDPQRIRLVHWYHGLDDDQMREPATHTGPIFSGGRSMRDYRALLECAPLLPQQVLIAAPSSRLPAGDALPGNVRAEELTHEGFTAAMREASVVVVPLMDAPDRSAGQSTYLTAMAMGKLVIATDTIGVRDHIDHLQTGLLVAPNDPGALHAAIMWALDPANSEAVEEIRAAARVAARTRFSPDAHITAVLGIVDEVGQRTAAAPLSNRQTSLTGGP